MPSFQQSWLRTARALSAVPPNSRTRIRTNGG
jgi:hypothetical protein